MTDIPLCRPYVGDEELEAVEAVLESGWLAHGPMNEELAERFADYVGVEHAIPMNSCTSALHLAIEAQGITGEVLVPSFTFVASANAIVTAGATPIFVDVEADTRNVDPERAAEAITDETEAIMVVHYAGQSCDMDVILELADEHDLAVIEDSAETIGGEYNGQKTGSFGTGCFSFYPTKNITTAEGGILTTDDDALAERVQALLGHGITSTAHDRKDADRSWYRAADYAGYNFRLSDVHAAIGVEQLKRIDELNDRRREHAHALTDALADVEGVEPPVELEDRTHVYQMYTVMTDESIPRNAFVEALNDDGIGASVHFYPPVHQQPRYEDDRYRGTSLEVTEYVSENIVTLPMYPQLTSTDVDRMAALVRAVANEL